MISCVVLIIVLALCGLDFAKSEDAPKITTKLGEIRGTVKKLNVFGRPRKVNRYFGIPYAEPPINELRFQKPVPKRTLDSPFDATKFGKVCLQMILIPIPEEKELSIGEDCLTLNVYVPEDGSGNQGNLPVMVWFHGGAFVYGAAASYTSDTLSAHGNVIVVTVNYRLSIWGFLSTEDEHASGNYGLWDQHVAIKWVNDNIEDFGGDPQRVTIFGESAGAASVVYQSHFSGNKGLIQRAIAQSGSITPMWATAESPKEDAAAFGKLVGCETSKSRELVRCLRNKSPDNINATLNDVSNGFMRFRMPFLPTVDREFVQDNPKDVLLGDSNLAAEGRKLFASVDLLIGINSQEGLGLLHPVTGVEDPENFEPNRTYFEKNLLPFILPHELGMDFPELIKDIIVQEYTDWSEPENFENRRTKLVDIYSDVFFGIPLIETAIRHRSLAKNSKNTFMYLFDILPKQRAFPAPSWAMGANHADERSYIFFDESEGMLTYMPWAKDYKPSDWDREYSEYIITMWTNFAKSGDPNRPVPVKTYWPVFTEKDQQYLHITRETTSDSVKSFLLTREHNVWRKIIPGILKFLGKTSLRSTVKGK